MSETQLVKISIERVQDDSEPGQPCHICQQPFISDDIRTTFSCCHALHHAECLSEWLVADRSHIGLPKCTRCKAAFYPNSFHYLMAQLATRSVHLVSRAESRAVGRISLEVRPSVEAELYYNPAGLLRRALRGENPTAAEAFHDESFSTRFETGAEQPATGGNIDASASTYDQVWDDRYGDEGPADDSESGYSSPYEDEETMQQEPGRAAEVQERQYGLSYTHEPEENTFSAVHVEDIVAETTTNDPYHTHAPVMIAGAQHDRQAPIHRNHWLYGTGHTIGDQPERDSSSNHDDTPAVSDGFSLPPSIEDAVGEFVPLYTRVHGLGRRVGEGAASALDRGASVSANSEATAMPTTMPADETELIQYESAAPLYSFEHGLGNRLGTGAINSDNTQYLYRAGRGRGRGSAWYDQLRAIGRFGHELGRGRTLGE